MHNEWSDELVQELLAPFSLAEEEYLPRGGKRERGDNTPKPTVGLVYLGAESVIARLNATVGPHNWSFSVDPVPTQNGVAFYGRLTVLGAVHEDFGEANGESELLKSARTDCLKRCARNVGIGLYLWFFPKDNWGKHDGFKWTEPPQIPHNARVQALRLAGWKGELAGSDAPQQRPAQRQQQRRDLHQEAESAMRGQERPAASMVANGGPGTPPATPSMGALDLPALQRQYGETYQRVTGRRIATTEEKAAFREFTATALDIPEGFEWSFGKLTAAQYQQGLTYLAHVERQKGAAA